MSDDFEFASVEEEGRSHKPGRRGDGGVYLVLADESEEFPIALRYAARLAYAHRGHVAILHVTEMEEFQHWGKVEAMMKQELRDRSEKFLWETAKRVNDLNGLIPSLYIREGQPSEQLVNLINEDNDIVLLILGGGTTGKDPGPMVQHFTGRGLHNLRVPVLIVPGHLDMHQIDALT